MRGHPRIHEPAHGVEHDDALSRSVPRKPPGEDHDVELCGPTRTQFGPGHARLLLRLRRWTSFGFTPTPPEGNRLRPAVVRSGWHGFNQRTCEFKSTNLRRSLKPSQTDRDPMVSPAPTHEDSKSCARVRSMA
ncbi:hypothetical protein FNV43_RR05664 [Rhamnella rubrinervis]|uniref:Uncharacterized protein n=1 Tax=Rhamnella rubrinervis TaxID=2594499 RepID=A0A8K0HMI0_9ROSA|nr:hypothetical protein FNV43_RR05664 [Rhamnella rubrinervis]